MLLQIWKKLQLPHPVQLFLMRFINDQFLIGVTGIIFNEHHQVLLLKHTYRKVEWSLPGGYLKANEHPKVGLAREILEETNFTIKVVKIMQTKTDHHGRLDLCYYGMFVRGKFKPSEEVSDFQFADPKHLPSLIQDQYQQIKDAIHQKGHYDAEHRWENITGKLHHLFTHN